MNREEIYKLIDAERDFQDTKWGPNQVHDLMTWQCILTEEVGELAQECLRMNFGGGSRQELIDEAVQVAAVIVAWLESSHARQEIVSAS